jgi:tripartite-type tricarboxylate transporter receptor subunit TctC
MALIVNKSSNITNLGQFKSVSTPMFFGSGGVGTGTHIAGEILKLQTKQDLIHAPYKGEAPAITDLIGGNINFLITGLTNATKFPDKLNVIAVTGRQRNVAIPTVPTFLEQGILAYDDHVQYALIYTNKSADTQQIKAIQKALTRAVSNPSQHKSLVDVGLLPDSKRLLKFDEFVENKQAQARMVWSKINVE